MTISSIDDERRIHEAADIVNSAKVSLGLVANEFFAKDDVEIARCIAHVSAVALEKAFGLLDGVLEGVEG